MTPTDGTHLGHQDRPGGQGNVESWAAPFVKGTTTVVGVFGDPIAHSLSPPMHNAAFRYLNLDWVYVPFHVASDRLAQAVAGVKSMGMAGVNVTVPHKVSIMAYLDELDEAARALGAVNTVVHRNGRLIGYNTDGRGFLRSLELEAGVTPKGRHVVILGAGGAALAIAWAVADANAASVVVANRTVEKAEAVAASIDGMTAAQAVPLSENDSSLKAALEQADILVHTTSVGMRPNHDVPPIVPETWLNPTTLVCDIVYTPRETTFIQAARRRGCPVVTGEGMLAFQGAVAFELWTNQKAPDELMLKTLRSLL